MTEAIFRDDSYLRSLTAQVTEITDAGGIVTNRTIFYPTGGGQPGDSGTLTLEDGTDIPVTTTIYADMTKTDIVHVPAPGASLPAIGANVTLAPDWTIRHGRMRIHTALHLLSVVLPYPVTGGSIGDIDGRLDFDLPDPNVDAADIEARLNDLILADHKVTSEWITDAELDANPGLVKTMSVQPPRGSGRIRLIRIATGPETIDLQPCGGTHVASTAEVGRIYVTKIEKKGKQNRRVRIGFSPAA